MSNRMTTRTVAAACAASAALTAPLAADDHLLLTEAVVNPTVGEFIEIGNPLASTVALADYYLSDDMDYALLPGEFGAGPSPNIGSSDFIARFPASAQITPGGVITIAVDGAGFITEYGFAADFELRGTDPGTPDMLEAFTGSIGALAGLTNSGENAVLFFWDGATDLVDDVDMVIIGNSPSSSNSIGNKTGLSVDGPDGDATASTYAADAFTMPDMAGDVTGGSSTQRILLEAGNETQIGIGNGITGHDETTELITTTWSGPPFDTPTPGVADVLPEIMGVVLRATKTGPPGANSGTQITYTLTIENVGNVAAENVEVTDTLPADLTFVSETSPMDVMVTDTTEPTIVWDAGTVDPQEVVVIELTVMIGTKVSGNVLNEVEVSTTTMGDEPSDNVDTHRTEVTLIVQPPEGLTINELRTNDPLLDENEYFELKGDPGTDLQGLSYIVIGDGADGDSGVIEKVVSLDGQSVAGDGRFLCAESTITLIPTFLVDFITVLAFEDGDNVTHALVANFVGEEGTDLDTNDDGVIDGPLPWTDTLDAVGLFNVFPPTGSFEWVYGTTLGFEDLGPDGTAVPAHVYRCLPGALWRLGTQDEFDPNSTDTPAFPNPTEMECEEITCPADTNDDGMVDIDDVINIVLDFGCGEPGNPLQPPCPNNGDVDDGTQTGTMDGVVNIDDVVYAILEFGLCR